jgi:hypothetical protein
MDEFVGGWRSKCINGVFRRLLLVLRHLHGLCSSYFSKYRSIGTKSVFKCYCSRDRSRRGIAKMKIEVQENK